MSVNWEATTMKPNKRMLYYDPRVNRVIDLGRDGESNAFRGILIALGLSAPFWLAIALLVWVTR